MKNQHSESRKPLDANHLKILAMFCMLLDHIWATTRLSPPWMHYVGRLAFPIFAFQLTEGFFHTRDRKKYKKRLLIFALISEIPFNLMVGGYWLYPFQQNVLWTFLLGLLAMEFLEKAKACRTPAGWIRGVGGGLLCVLAGMVLAVDYGGIGVATVLVFYLFPGRPLFQFAGLFVLLQVIFKGQYFAVPVFGTVLEWNVEAIGILAMVPICLYNGKRGSTHPFFRWAGYVFYPEHMTVLCLLSLLW